jgi:signal transduction histidine kinase/CheY-like chemotaxis protein
MSEVDRRLIRSTHIAGIAFADFHAMWRPKGLPPAPLPNSETVRLEALLQCSILDSGPEQAFDDLTTLSARLIRAPVAVLSLVDEARQWFKSRVGTDLAETPRSQAFCAYAILGDEPLVVEDASLDPRFSDNPLVTGAPGIRFYAGAPLRLSTGEALGTLCVIDTEPRTITSDELETLEALARQAIARLELRRRTFQLERARSLAEESARAKSMFLANMSHEFRTPLGAIIGFSDVLRDHLDGAESARDAAGAIRRNAEHLLEIVDDVIDASRLESRVVRVAAEPCEPCEIAAEVCRAFQAVATDRGVSLTFERPAGPRARIVSDPLKIRHVLTKLIENAVRFTERGGVTVRVREMSAVEHAPMISIEVEDTGVGMTPEALESAFDAFSQADLSLSRSHGGAGLGLTIARRYAEAMSGSLDARSTPGRGSVFTLSLPATPALRDADSGGDTESGAPLEGVRVLVVEDFPDNQRLIRHHLTMLGIDVTLAANGTEALDRVRDAREPFDLVLMDIQMPVMDGRTATRELRSRGFAAPILALTALVTPADRDACLLAGCDDFVVKPANRATLHRTISRHLARRCA